MNDITSKILQIGQQAKDAAKLLAKTSTDTKNKALLSMAEHIKNNKQSILDANNTDIENGSKKILIKVGMRGRQGNKWFKVYSPENKS